MFELREAIAKEMTRSRGVSLSIDNIVVTPGAKSIMFFTLLALAQEGDGVIHPNPGFPIYESVIRFAGAKPVPVPLREELDFSLDVNELKDLVTDCTKLIIINSPQNPTGGILPEEDLKDIAQIAMEYEIAVLSDEVYSRILYDGEFASISAFDGIQNLLIILEGFSKTYAMTGWRIGYGVMPAKLAAHITRLMINSNSCTASFTQRAAISALNGPQDAVRAMVGEFKKRRDFFVKGLNEIPGIICTVPKGAFYLFPNITGLGKSSREVADYFLNEGGVATLAGPDFGAYGEGFLRFSYATSLKNIRKALERIAACASTLKG